jgi:hypothetical protein
MGVSRPVFPIFVLVPDEGGTIRRNANQRELNWFEQIDIEDMEHVGWDFEAKPVRLTWSTDSDEVEAVVMGPCDLEGLEQAARKYLEICRRLRKGHSASHLCDPGQLEADLKSIRQST